MLPPTALTVEDIDLACDVGSADELFMALARLIAHQRADVVNVLRHRFAKRHAQRSFVLGGGTLLARTTLVHLRGPRAAYARCLRPLDLGSPDGQPVTEAMALVVPHPALLAEHAMLQTLEAALSRPRETARRRTRTDAEGVRALLVLSER